MARRSRKTPTTEAPDTTSGEVALVGQNGVRFTVQHSVASGLVASGSAEYANEADAEPAPQPDPPATAPTPNPSPDETPEQ